MRIWLLTFITFIAGFVSLVVTESEPEPDPELYKRCENSETGQRYREAETWTEEGNCAECICQKDGPECSELVCPQIMCAEGSKSGTLPGKCCPSCISACVDNKGKEYGHLESWSPDPCTECECLVDENTGDKEEVCSMMDCPDTGECDRRIITPPDQCCSICPEHCVDNDGKEYGQGETWSPDPCTHCTCEVNEDTGEKQEMCAVMDCEDPAGCNKEMIRIPDQCCPICPEHCVDNDGKEYGQGETWSPDPCTHCTCEVNEDTGEKQEMCAVSGCAWPGDCPWDTITPDDQCCPICPCTNPETGETHKVGEGFQADPCTHCTCMEKGILQCDMIMCDIPNCLELNGGGWRMWNKPGSCCPGCIGPCSDDTGKEYEIGESWKRTSCKECKCIDKDGGKMEICDDICETKPVECQRFVIHGQDFICLDDYNCDAVKCAAPDLYSRTYADKCCTHSIPDECGLEDCASLDCNYKDAVYISTSPCCPICVILTPPTEVPPPTEPPDECALVDCPAPPKCVTGYPVTFEGDCCASCKPDYCNAVDCMPVHPNCESVYTSKSPCCPVCKDPPVCPEGEDMALCFSDPCTSTKCRNYPYAECKASFCGECTAIFYDENGDVITNCEGDCLDGQLFKECGSACTPTCKNPLPACTKNCVRRCECLFARSILYKQSCIPENECPDYLPYCDEIYSDEDSDGDIDFAQTSSSGSSSGSRNTRSVQTTEVTDPDCGEADVECDEDPCETAKCPNFPYAKCRVDTCGKCQAVFYHDTGSRIDNCKGDCLGNMIFNNCGSACTATCSNPNPVCIEMCVARCECPSDVPLLTGSHCNPRDECPEEEEGNSNSGGGGGSGGSGEMCRPRYPDSEPEPEPEPVPPEPECGDIVNCFENPCKVQSCPNYPRARCRANYCGGCNADFYDSSGARISDCEGECKAPKKYTECGSACPQTCFSDPSLPCIAVCVPGCSCPSSAPVLYRGKCITRDMCPTMDEVEAMDESKRLFDDPSETDTIRDSSTSVLSITLTLGILTIVRLVFF